MLIAIAGMNAECIGVGSDLNIYAVKYGNSKFRNSFVFYGDKSGNSVPFCWLFYYVEYGKNKILIDTGFNDQKMVKLFGISDFRDPVVILKDNGIEADQITDVIITHSHFDHIGNALKFKNARILINKDELAELNKNHSLDDIKKFINNNPKVTVFDDSMMLYDFFTIKKIGGHTKGSSVVLFSYGNENYCFTGDEIYLRENFTLNTGNGSVVNHRNNINFINFLKKGNYKVFIFHDNLYSETEKRFIKVFPSD